MAQFDGFLIALCEYEQSSQIEAKLELWFLIMKSYFMASQIKYNETYARVMGEVAYIPLNNSSLVLSNLIDNLIDFS